MLRGPITLGPTVIGGCMRALASRLDERRLGRGADGTEKITAALLAMLGAESAESEDMGVSSPP
jgi:hypothetical protein